MFEPIPEEKEEFLADPLDEYKQALQERNEALIFCESRERNPNYLSIIFANKKFYEIFGVSEFNLIGKSYDFLFADLDLDYSSEDQLEYVRLIKAVKDSHQCSVIISVSDHKGEGQRVRLKITFTPVEINSADVNKLRHHATFSFEKVESDEVFLAQESDRKPHVALLRNLERTLRNERLLREVGSLIISDLPIRDIAQNIAKLLCEHLKTDRCLIHDYNDGQTSFVVESCNNYTKHMLKPKSRHDNGAAVLIDYINFQNHFYKKFGNKVKKSSLSIIEDILLDRNFLPIHHLCEDFSINSQIAVTTTFNRCF